MDTRTILAITASFLTPACTLTSATSSSADVTVAARPAAKFEFVERLIEEEFAKDRRGGLTVGIVENGDLVWTHSLGYADEEAARPAAVDTVYPIASVTKMVTGLMLLRLVERGQVHLADPVECYVPEVRAMKNAFPWAPSITLMQLATMTAGLGGGGLFVPPEISGAVRSAKTWEEKVALVIPTLEYQYEPGTVRRYSNISYVVLGLALSRAAKRPFAEYVRSEILEPLAMHDSALWVTAQLESRVVRGYALDKPDARGTRVWSSEHEDLLLPAGGLLTTVGDLAKLMRFQSGGGPDTVLSRSALQASYRLLVPSDADLRYGDGVGFAAIRDPDSKLTALGHGGAFPDGFITSYEFDGSTRTGVILLANTNNGRAEYKPLVRKILATLHPTSAGGSGLPLLEKH